MNDNYTPEWWCTTDLEALAEAIHYQITFEEGGMKHWHGMCEFLRKHLWGMGLERYLKLGYIPEYEQEIMDKAQWGGNAFRRGTMDGPSYSQRIYGALRHETFSELLNIYNAAKGQNWNAHLRDALIDDVEDPKGRFNRKAIAELRTSDVIGLAKGFFMNPDAGVQTVMLPDAMLEAGCVDDKLIQHVIQNMTRGSVIIQTLIWGLTSDGIKNPGDVSMWDGNPR